MKKIVPALLLAMSVSVFAGESEKVPYVDNSSNNKVSKEIINHGDGPITNNILDATTNNDIKNEYKTNIPSHTQSNTTARVTTTPSMGAPQMVASGSDACLGSMSGAISLMGFGASGGGTQVDENCVLLKNSQRLAQMNMPDAAVALFASKPENLEAIRLGSPRVYLSILTSKYNNLKAEIEAYRDFDKPLGDREAQLEDLALQLTIAHNLTKQDR